MFGEFDVLFLVMAFCGGIFGAAIGALPSFVLCGFGALIGSAVAMASQGAVSTDLAITWGAFVGPQAAFAGGTAAAAYAKKIGVHDNGRDICTSLLGLNNQSVLLVGGIFGVLGALLTWGLSKLPAFTGGALPELGTILENGKEFKGLGSTNAIALAIIICMILTRVCFGKTGVLGDVPKGKNRWISDDKGCWVPWQSDWGQVLLVSFAVGLPAAYAALKIPQSGLLIFGFGCISFIYLQYGTKIPVFHHIALAAFLGATGTGSIYWGLAMAMTCGFMCEVFAVLFVYHGDTHIDPPTFALTFMGTLQPILLWTGVMPVGSTPCECTPITFSVIISAVFVLFFILIRRNKGAIEACGLNSELSEETA